jgi:hypothetical protein
MVTPMARESAVNPEEARMIGKAMILGIVLTAVGCAHNPRPGQVVTVRGELSAGAECLMVTSSDGRRYSITGNPGNFKIGDRVCIRGKVAEMSICMAGEATVSIEAIGPENDCP